MNVLSYITQENRYQPYQKKNYNIQSKKNEPLVNIKTKRPRSRDETDQTFRQDAHKETIKTNKDKLQNMEIMPFLVQVLSTTFANFHNKSYFVPACFFNRVSHKVVDVGAGVKVKTLVPSTQMSDTREDEAIQRVIMTVQVVFSQSKDVVFVISGLDFDNILNNASNLRKLIAEVKEKSSDCPWLFKFQEVVSLANDRLDLSVFPRPRDLGTSFQRGKFDLIIVGRQFGIVIFKIKAVGDAFSLSPNHQTITSQYEAIRERITKALQQLVKDEQVMRYLMKDLSTPATLPVVKCLALPNLSRQTAEAALMQDVDLVRRFCLCLGETSLKDALRKCIFSDNLPPIAKPWDVTSDITNRLLKDWWPLVCHQNRQEPAMSEHMYESIIARLCGPATTQYVSTSSESRVDVNTLQQAVLETAKCFSEPVLNQDEVELLLHDHPRTFLTGQPGTNGSVLLGLKAICCLKKLMKVLVVSFWDGSETASTLLHSRISQNAAKDSSNPYLILSRNGEETLHVEQLIDTIVDIVYPPVQRNDGNCLAELPPDMVRGDTDPDSGFDSSDFRSNENEGTSSEERNTKKRNKINRFRDSPGETYLRLFEDIGSPSLNEVLIVIPEAPWFVHEVIAKLDDRLSSRARGQVMVWTSSRFWGWKIPTSFQHFHLERSFRCPPAVVREVMKSPACSAFVRSPYASLDTGVLSGMPPPTDGPRVKRISHSLHGEIDVWDCESCGADLAGFLKNDLQIGYTQKSMNTKRQTDFASTNKPLCLSDVLISGYVPCLDDLEEFSLVSSSSMHEMNAAAHAGGSTDNDLQCDSQPGPQQVRYPGFLAGLQKCGIGSRIIRAGDREDLYGLPSPTGSNRVQVAEPVSVLGLERPVVVVLGNNDVRRTYPRYVDPVYDVMATCTAQLIIVGDTADDFYHSLRNLTI